MSRTRTTLGAPAPSAPHRKTERVGAWRQVTLLSETRYNRVFRAQPLDRPDHWPADYVVKVARAEASLSAMADALIQREAYVASRVRHPNVMSVLESQLEKSPYYLVTPFITGRTLSAVIEACGRLPWSAAFWFARQTVEALQAVHSAGFLHGDVKPDNLLIGGPGHVTLTDFGFARTKNVLPDAHQCVMATPRYAAPELFGSGEPTTAASDVYSLGVMLFEMLTGAAPYLDDEPLELLNAHRQRPIPEPRDGVMPFPPRIAGLIGRLLAKQPDRRPDLAEVRRILIELEIEWLEERLPARALLA